MSSSIFRDLGNRTSSRMDWGLDFGFWIFGSDGVGIGDTVPRESNSGFDEDTS
jgi:hypothetical protein